MISTPVRRSKKARHSSASGRQGDDIVGTSLSAPHPYNVKPSGNALLAPPRLAQVRVRGLGCMAAVEDGSLLDLLALLGIRDLCAVVSSSRALYVYGHDPNLWRSLALDCFGGGKKSTRFTRSWKETCAEAFLAHVARGGKVEPRPPTAHTPLRVAGIFSDALFRPW